MRRGDVVAAALIGVALVACGGSEPPPKPPPPQPKPPPVAKVQVKAPEPLPSDLWTPPPPTQSGCDATTCTGALTQQLTDALNAAVAKTQDCYSVELNKRSTSAGRMDLAFKVAESGKLCSFEIVKDEVNRPDMTACVKDAMAKISDLAPPTGGCITLKMPVAYQVAP